MLRRGLFTVRATPGPWGQEIALPETDPRSVASARRLAGPRPEVEAEAFRRLGALDVEGARRAFHDLTAWIRSPGAASPPEDDRATVLWLHGLLQDVHRRLARAESDGSDEDASRRFDETRWDLCRRFADVDSPGRAREEFRRCLDELLAPWNGRRPDGRPIVERARLLIQHNYQSRISLSAVARRLHVSSNYLSRQFRRETGMTLTRYIQKVRLAHARRLLVAGGRSISEIAYLVGYQNYRDFYRNFVKYENASPSEVAKRLTART